MQDSTNDVDGAHDDELVTVYDTQNFVIAVGKLFRNIGEFRMYFKTYRNKKDFDAKTKWTDKKEVLCEI
jgi:hypothetical protein